VKNVCIKKGIVLIIILLALFCVYSPSTGFKQDVKLLVFNDGNILYVGGIGEGNYTKIQDAINASVDGDTVFVFGDASPYHENVVVDKSIFLIGEDKNLVVIDAGFYGAAVTIIADDVFVSGFKMITFHDNPNQFDSELVDILSSENVTIKDNIIQQNKITAGSDRGGVILRNSSYCFIQNNTIIKEEDGRPCWGVVLMLDSGFVNVSGNEVYNYTGGIYVRGCSDNEIYMNYLHNNSLGINIQYNNNNKVINNIVIFNKYKGIRIDGGYNNLISRNIVTDNGEGKWDDYGIGLIGGSDNFISYNYISNNNQNGILIISDFNNIEYNYISNNNIGVYFDYADSNNIEYNYISNNNIGVFCNAAHNNDIVRNNFIQNGKNGYFEGVIYRRYKNIWDGNYWDEPRTKPYPIFGIGYFLFFTFNKWVVFDWHPTQEPYDI